MRRLFALLLTLTSGGALLADTLYLRDGRTLRGTFISGTSSQIRFLEDGSRTRAYPVSDVNSVTFGNAVSSAESSYPASSRSRAGATMVPAGTVINVRMIDSIDSDATNVGETFRASVDDPVVVNGRTLIPKGADATVKVVRVEQSGTLSGREEVAVELAQLQMEGRRLVAASSHAQVAAKSRSSETAKIVGGTAIVGAIIGAIAGGGKGAAIGAATGAGAGAAIQAIRGQRVKIPTESHLQFTLSEPLYLD